MGSVITDQTIKGRSNITNKESSKNKQQVLSKRRSISKTRNRGSLPNSSRVKYYLNKDPKVNRSKINKLNSKTNSNQSKSRNNSANRNTTKALLSPIAINKKREALKVEDKLNKNDDSIVKEPAEPSKNHNYAKSGTQFWKGPNSKKVQQLAKIRGGYLNFNRNSKSSSDVRKNEDDTLKKHNSTHKPVEDITPNQPSQLEESKNKLLLSKIEEQKTDKIESNEQKSKDNLKLSSKNESNSELKQSTPSSIDKKGSKSDQSLLSNVIESEIDPEEIIDQYLDNLDIQNYHWLSKLEQAKRLLPHFDPATVIDKKIAGITGFSVNTHTGIVRNYNEDRISIFLNAQQR